MTVKQLRINDVSLTDGQSSVWGGGMTSAMRLYAINQFENTGLAAIEVGSSETIMQGVARDDNPWQSLEMMRYQIQTVPFRVTLSLLTEHGLAGADILTGSVLEHLVAELANRNVSQIVFIEPLLRKELLVTAFKAAAANGVIGIAALPYSSEDGVSDEEYVKRATDMIALGAGRLMLRDESGVLTPDRLASLVPALQEALGETPLILHTRCTTGLGPLVAVQAVKLGVCELDTAVSALANGGSAPSSTTLLDSLAALDIEVDGPDREVLEDANSALADIASCEEFDAADPWGFELAQYVHQLPGSVASWALQQLKVQGFRGALFDFAHECARVREDIGSPPVIAPFARGIAEQALLNLADQQRYSRIRPLVRRALQGVYGQTSGEVNSELLDRVGMVDTPAPSSWEDICAGNPGANRAQLIAMQVAGRPVQRLAAPVTVDQKIYGVKTPAEVLVEGLKQYVGTFGTIRVTGPGVDIQAS
jgi:oxaloacetate decarboxylase alpha subunit